MGHVTLPTVVNGEFYPPSYVRMLRIFEFEAVAFQNADLRSTYIGTYCAYKSMLG